MSAYGARQLTLLADPLDLEFGEHHRAHPEIYDALAQLAREWKAAGHTRCSIGLLWERLRWEYGIRGAAEGPAFNNNHRSRYARLLMWNEPDLAGFFETRVLRSTHEVAS